MLILPPTMGSGDRPVLRMMPHAVDGRETQLIRGDASDVFGGATEIDTDEAVQTVQRSYQFLCSNRSEISELREFFKARKGRYQSFFFPTWRWEFGLCGYEEPNAGSFFMWLTHTRLASTMARNPTLGWFVVSRGTGCKAHLVTDPAEIVENIVPGVDRVHFSDKGSVGIAPPQFFAITKPNETYRVYWMMYGRFDSDKITFEYEGDDMATVTVPITETPDEVPSA
jgi:hypothetical protein